VTNGDSHIPNQPTVVKVENQNGWIKGDNNTSNGSNTQPLSGTEDVTFIGASDGIYITVNNSGSNKIKLFALTGQLLLDKDFNQGRFFIPQRKGIYFLKINNKSYKVICR
jgi:hypothetical protein